MDHDIRAIAMYLPQFHPVEENDTWWGKGFTEWRATSRARPAFEGHLQPHEPADLGFYDLRVPEVREAQANLAREYGIHGFCYYHYWFDGKRILERPLDEVLGLGSPDFPFCLAWANEPWVRSWTGQPDDTLVPQSYGEGWETRFFLDTLPYLKDPRYIRVKGMPLLLVSRALAIPDVGRCAAIWRGLATLHGLDGLYLAAVQSKDMVDPRLCGFDAAVEFPPFGAPILRYPNASLPGKAPEFQGTVASYEGFVDTCLEKDNPPYTWFRGVMPGWDNSPRRGNHAMLFADGSPAIYERWVSGVSRWTRRHREDSERLVFVNAWNEWGEGAHLEPDLASGHAYLEATRAGLARALVERAIEV